MKFSRSLINTIKDYKKEDTEGGLRSQEYLTRGGFVHQVASGVYDFLPLGKMMLDNIQNIIKEEEKIFFHDTILFCVKANTAVHF